MAAAKTGGSFKKVDKFAIVHQSIPPVVVAPIPSSSEGSNWTMLSTADSWNSSQHVTKCLEGLKNWEADREGTPFRSFTSSVPMTLFTDY
jgi:hypothetical protein